MSKPTFVFVPGAWHTASLWSKVTSLLDKQGYKSTSVTLPSTTEDPNATFLDDVQAVRDAVLSATSQGRDVVVVVHSYGGLVGESALKLVPTVKNPSPEPASGKVIGLALISSGFSQPNTTSADQMRGQAPPTWFTHDTESGFAVFTNNPPPEELFYHDLPAAEAEEWSSRLTRQSLKSISEGPEHVYTGWRDVPCWYLVTSQDRAFPAVVQRMMIGMAREAGVSVEAREVESGHSPMLAKPEETVKFLVEAATALAK